MFKKYNSTNHVTTPSQNPEPPGIPLLYSDCLSPTSACPGTRAYSKVSGEGGSWLARARQSTGRKHLGEKQRHTNGGKVENGLVKNVFVCTPSPGITSTRKAAFVGKGEEGRRGGDREEERRKQASYHPLFTLPQTDAQDSRVALGQEGPSVPQLGPGGERHRGGPAGPLLLTGRDAAGAQASPASGPHEEALTPALAPALSCIWHQVCLHL